MKTKLLVLANMVNNGRAFCVVQMPDWNGGHYCTLRPAGYEVADFEYILWEGTPSNFSVEAPCFTEHYEPLHEEVKDVTITAYELLRWYINR